LRVPRRSATWIKIANSSRDRVEAEAGGRFELGKAPVCYSLLGERAF
jgi:hypothetical protein